MNFRRFALVREVIVDFRLLGRRLSFWLRCLGTELLALFDEHKTIVYIIRSFYLFIIIHIIIV